MVVSAAKADGAAGSDPIGLVGHLIDRATIAIDQDDGVALVAKPEPSGGCDLYHPAAGCAAPSPIILLAPSDC
jgi:hypothetical protein